MKLKLSLWAALSTLLFSTAVYAGPSLKHGTGVWTWGKEDEKGLKNLAVSWCYNWRTSPNTNPWMKPPFRIPHGIEFVAMVHNASSVTPKDLTAAKSHGKILLGFNEPDRKDQANMTVEQALELWPQLQATGMRLGSPVTANGATSDTSWFGRFMAGAKAKGYRVDFICLHSYNPNYTDPVAATAQLKRYIQAVSDKYQKPIWLTEFALSNWKAAATAEQQAAYIKEVIPMLENLPCLERYAWFTLMPYKKEGGILANTSLCNADGSLSDRGRMYQKTGAEAGENRAR